MYYVLLLILLGSAPLTAQILLDQAMSKEDQKQTGVSTLSYQQKLKLEEWLDTHCVLKTTEPSSPSTQSQDLTLALNIQGGKRLQLSDNSVWEIAPNDVPNASFWILPTPITVSSSNDVNYPFLLTNQNSGISVRARKVREEPASPSG